MSGALFEAVLWICLAVVAALVVVAALRMLAARVRRRREGRMPKHAVDGARGATGGGRDRPDGPLPEFESLAREGRFADAIHALLLHAIHEAAARGGAFHRAFTSREILAQLRARGPDPGGFESLVLETERVHFGRRAAEAADFDRCRGHLVRWMAALGGAPR